MINVRKTKLFFGGEEIEFLSAFDPRQILSIFVYADAIEIFNLDRVYNLNKKMHIYLPERKNTGGIQVRSIQKTSNCLIVETTGPLTSQVVRIVRKISEAMKSMEVKDAFFPVHSLKEDPSIFFAGEDIDSLKYVMDDARGIKNIRLVNEHILAFTSGRELKKMPVIDLGSENWIANSLHVWTAPEEIAFVGRVKDLMVPITLQSGMIMSIDIFKGMEVKTGDNIAGSVGYVYKNIGAAVANDEIILYPR